MNLFKLHGKHIGIDLGTSTILMVLKDKGIVKSEPSIVAIESSNKDILAIGREAKEMLGKTPEKISSLMPMLKGGISNLSATEMIIRRLIKELQEKEDIGNPKVLINVHIGMNDVEKRAIIKLLQDMGVKDISFIEETLAAAIGADLDVDSHEATMMLNIGGGTSEVAVIAFGKVTACNYIRIAGDDLDNDIIDYIKKKMLIVIGKNTAETLKINLASISPVVNKNYEVTGRDLKTGLPKTITVNAFQVNEAIRNSLEKIIDMVRETLDRTPPELLNDIQNNGLVISGGGACIEDIDKLISNRLKINVKIADKPLECTALGIKKVLNDDSRLKELMNKRRI